MRDSCRDIAELWAKLPAWERLGEEVTLAGCVLPEWLCRVALEKLLPLPLLERLVDKPDLQDVGPSVEWVKTQMEHARGVAQAAAFAPNASGKDADGDVYMNSVQAAAAESSDAARWAVDEAMAAGDYETALYALKGAKGSKGGRKGLGKGSGKSGGGGKDAGGSPDFNGACHYCGMWGHRQQDCSRKTADMAKSGGGGGKGAKGTGKGGKGPKDAKGPLNEVAAEDEGDWAGDGADADEDRAAAAWDCDSSRGRGGADVPQAGPGGAGRARRDGGGCLTRHGPQGATLRRDHPREGAGRPGTQVATHQQPPLGDGNLASLPIDTGSWFRPTLKHPAITTSWTNSRPGVRNVHNFLREPPSVQKGDSSGARFSPCASPDSPCSFWPLARRNPRVLAKTSNPKRPRAPSWGAAASTSSRSLGRAPSRSAAGTSVAGRASPDARC